MVGQAKQLQGADDTVIQTALQDQPDVLEIAFCELVELVLFDELYSGRPTALDLFLLMQERGGRQDNTADVTLRVVERFGQRKLGALLFGVSIGGIYLGWFSPTESAAVGSFGAFLLGLVRGRLTWKRVHEAVVETVLISSMLFLVVLCAFIFSYFVVLTELPQTLVEWTRSLNASPAVIMLILIVFYIIMGCFLDGIGMVLITVPVFFPLVVGAGFDPVWFGVLLVLVVELGLVTPPVGMNIFVIRAQAPEIPLSVLYRGVFPFLIAPLALLLLMVWWPDIALWFPSLLYR